MSTPVHIPIGTEFGWLTALWPVSERTPQGRMQYECVCECGKGIIVPSQNLRTFNTKSCGCKKVGLIKKFLTRHGQSHIGNVTPEYKTFQHAKARCTNPREVGFANYGGRGIEFRFTSFEAFFAVMGKRPSSSHSIDRIDNNGHYEAGNVRWATAKEQANNRRPRTAREGK